MRILITNIRLSTFGGTEMVVELLAEGLRRAGHDPMLYSPSLGLQAARLRERGFVVVDRVAELPHRPDIIHAQHTPVALAALAAFPNVPAVFACHSSVFELEAPRPHPQIRKWIAVDELCGRRCLSSGVSAAHLTIILNAVDMDRFARRAPLPTKPRRALLLTKNVGHHGAVRAACARHDIALDELGAATGRVSAELEKELLTYDVVFGTARMALEAAAVGCAVIVADGRGFAGMLTAERVAAWRRMNLGLGLLVHPTTEDALSRALEEYDPADAAAVTDHVRAEASFTKNTDQHLGVYAAAMAATSPGADMIAAATARWLEDLTPTGERRPWRALAQETFGIAAPPLTAVLNSMERRIHDSVEDNRRSLEATLKTHFDAASSIGRARDEIIAVNRSTAGPDESPAMRGYAICTTPRSGSNYLCQLLRSTGTMGTPLEYFNAPARRKLDDISYPGEPPAQVQRVLSGATSNGVYGVKIFPWQLQAALSSPDELAPLTNLHFVRLKRHDRLRQAISWLRALQTGQYRLTQTPRGQIAYDRAAIAERILEISRAEASWDAYFAKSGLAPPCLVYEDVLADPQTAVSTVAELIGLDEARIDCTRIDMVAQRDAITEDWRLRFLAEHGGWNSIDVLSAAY